MFVETQLQPHTWTISHRCFFQLIQHYLPPSQRDQPGHNLVPIKDFLKMSQEDLEPGFSGDKPGSSGRSERTAAGDVKSTLLVDDCENLCVS